LWSSHTIITLSAMLLSCSIIPPDPDAPGAATVASAFEPVELTEVSTGVGVFADVVVAAAETAAANAGTLKAAVKAFLHTPPASAYQLLYLQTLARLFNTTIAAVQICVARERPAHDRRVAKRQKQMQTLAKLRRKAHDMAVSAAAAAAAQPAAYAPEQATNQVRDG